MSELAVLGAGVMGGAVLSALIAAGQDPAAVRATTLDPATAQHLRDEVGVRVVDNIEAVSGAEVVLLSVKPADAGAVVHEVGPYLREDVTLVSLCAGVSTAFLESLLPRPVAVVRVMPNTPALLGEGMSVLSPGSACGAAQLTKVEELLRVCGDVQVVPESQQDAVTAVSGSGPAYAFYLAEAMIDAGVLLGLSRPVATRLTVQTIHGAASMMRDGGHPGRLREQVTSPAGTTAAALRTLEARAVRAAVTDAMKACAERSAELGALAAGPVAETPRPSAPAEKDTPADTPADAASVKRENPGGAVRDSPGEVRRETAPAVERPG